MKRCHRLGRVSRERLQFGDTGGVDLDDALVTLRHEPDLAGGPYPLGAGRSGALLPKSIMPPSAFQRGISSRPRASTKRSSASVTRATTTSLPSTARCARPWSRALSAAFDWS